MSSKFPYISNLPKLSLPLLPKLSNKAKKIDLLVKRLSIISSPLFFFTKIK